MKKMLFVCSLIVMTFNSFAGGPLTGCDDSVIAERVIEEIGGTALQFMPVKIIVKETVSCGFKVSVKANLKNTSFEIVEVIEQSIDESSRFAGSSLLTSDINLDRHSFNTEYRLTQSRSKLFFVIKNKGTGEKFLLTRVFIAL